MANFIKTEFNNQTVKIDGNSFMGCVFNNCVLEYYGEADVVVTDCQFTNCQWRLSGAAGRTADFLRALYRGFGPTGKEMIDSILYQNYIAPVPIKEKEKSVRREK